MFLMMVFFSSSTILAQHQTEPQSDCSTSNSDPDFAPIIISGMPSCAPPDNAKYIIKVFVWVLRKSDGSEGRTETEVNQLLEQMINDFAKHGIHFSILGIDTINNDDYYDFQYCPSTLPDCEGDFQEINAQYGDPDRIDIFIAGDESINTANLNSASANGRAIAVPSTALCFGGFNFEEILARRIISHEMGHCLGLVHTQYETECGSYCSCELDENGDCPPICVNVSGCCPEAETPNGGANDDCQCGDFIEASETESDPGISFADDLSDCNGPGPRENIMSGGGPCKKEFAVGQADRMKYIINNASVLANIKDTQIQIVKEEEDVNITLEESEGCYPSITIKKGARLTISSTLKMCDNTQITIETGGRLVIDGGTITHCENYWNGIVVKGNPNMGQLPPTNQGYLVVKNGGTIERAIQAVKVEAGGLVIGKGGHFLNNPQGVLFEKQERHNISNFNTCIFSHDNLQPKNFQYHVKLQGNSGTSYKACTFEFVHDENPTLISGVGMWAFNSKFTVDNQTNFNNHLIGIDVGKFDAEQYYQVKNSTFKNCIQGIRSTGVNNFVVTDNIFNVGAYPNLPPGFIEQIGFNLQRGTGFKLRDNTFKGTSNEYHTGILADGTGGEDNFIINNQYFSIKNANRAEGHNNGEGDQGLQYWCNHNVGNAFDFHVLGKGVSQSQGLGLATLNTFSEGNITQFGDFYNESEVKNISYYYKNGETNHLPDNYFRITPFGVFEENQCAEKEDDDNENPDPRPTDDTRRLKAKYDENQRESDAANERLIELYDGGDTEALLDSINNVTEENQTYLTNTLFSISPYLSAAALRAILEQTLIFSEPTVVAIFTFNPDAIYSASLIDAIHNTLSPVSAATIMASLNTTTSRTQLENEAAFYRSEAFQYAGLLIRDILADTLSIDMDSLQVWLHHKNSLEAELERVSNFVVMNDAGLAYQTLDNISLLFDLNEEQITDLAYYEQLTDLALEAQTEGHSIYDFSLEQQQRLKNIADENDGLAGTKAKALFNFAYNGTYNFTSLQEGIAFRQNTNENELFKNKAIEPKEHVKAFPNPAREQVVFSYQLLQLEQPAELIILDFNGRPITRIPITEAAGTLDWNTSYLGHGVYWYCLSQAGVTPKFQKLVILK